MENMRHRIARIAVQNRWISLSIALVITAFFSYGLKDVHGKTIFSDLFPTTHPFVKTFKDHPNFGNPLTVTMMIERTDGQSIYNADTLAKMWWLSRDIDLVPGVNHDQIVSIATEKARYVTLTADGIYSNPILDEHLPKTDAELTEIKRRVNESPSTRTFLVSKDATSLILNATFIERLVDYGVVFDDVQALVTKYSDDHTKIFVAGFPTLTGWVYHFGSQTPEIFAVTLGLMFLFLVIVMRNLAGVLTPALVSGMSAIWGFGFVGWIQQPVEPLLMVVPLLLIARSFSHSVQATERYFEVFAEVGNKSKAAELSLAVMIAPGTLGIFTDVCGLLMVGVAPIPALQRFALFTGFWAAMLVPTSVIMTQVFLSILPAPKNVADRIGRNAGGVQKALNNILLSISKLSTGAMAKYTAVAFIIFSIASLAMMLRIQIGNPVEGSNLLRYDSAFNTAVREINEKFPGVMTLEVVFEGKEGRILRQSDTLVTMTRLQHCVENHPHPPTATLSFADYAPDANRMFNGGNPKWSAIDHDDLSASAASVALMVGASPTAYAHVADFDLKNATVSLWYANNKQTTVDAALIGVRQCLAMVGTEHQNFRIRLATGAIALQQSINETVDLYQWYIMAGINLVIGIGCTWAYRSFAAALILLVPVNLANVALTAFMTLAGLGLDVNSLPILAIGIGVGIDYGIYLLTRICEEYRDPDDLGNAITRSLQTCGKAILFTAVLMTIGIAPWYFLCDLKFLSDMGLLLVVVMTINMVLALVLVPLLVYLFKPKFLSAEHSFLSESVEGLLDSPMHKQFEDNAV